MRFELDEDQQARFAEWAKTKPESKAADGAHFEFKFIPTGLGVITRVKCLVTNTEIDLSDYANW